MLSAALNWVQGLFTAIWNTALSVLTNVLQWFADVISAVLGVLVDLLMALLGFAVGLLNALPSLPSTGVVPNLIVTANYFIPVDVAFACLLIIGGFWLGNYLYKSAKFMRGGG